MMVTTNVIVPPDVVYNIFIRTDARSSVWDALTKSEFTTQVSSSAAPLKATGRSRLAVETFVSRWDAPTWIGVVQESAIRRRSSCN